MRLRPTKSTIALLSGALVLIVLVTGGIVWYQQDSLGRTLTVLAQRQAEMHDGQRVARRREEAHSALEQDRAQLAFLENGVSDAAYVPTLLKQLEELAHTTSNKVLGVRPQVETVAPTRIQQRRDPDAAVKGDGKDKEKDKDGKDKDAKPEPYTRLSIQVSLVGGYKSTQDFLDRLTRFPKIVAVNEMQIRPHHGSADKNADLGQLDVDLKLTAFVMKDSAPAPSRELSSAVTANAALGGIN